jgi:hypothetical protein
MSALYQRPRPLALACLAGLTASCAYFVSYDGFRGGADDLRDGAASEAGPPAEAAAVDAPFEAGPSDARSDAPVEAASNGCAGEVPGVYCGRALPKYGGGTQDLVLCRGDGTMGQVTPCANGCTSMPAGRQDACNPCAGRTDGPYCLQELVLDYPGNDVVLTCSGNVVINPGLCTVRCQDSACR